MWESHKMLIRPNKETWQPLRHSIRLFVPSQSNVSSIIFSSYIDRKARSHRWVVQWPHHCIIKKYFSDWQDFFKDIRHQCFQTRIFLRDGVHDRGWGKYQSVILRWRSPVVTRSFRWARYLWINFAPTFVFTWSGIFGIKVLITYEQWPFLWRPKSL